jgi:hypothetical protein
MWFRYPLCWASLAALPCKLRVQYPGTSYHVMSDGGRCEPIFQDEADRRSGGM